MENAPTSQAKIEVKIIFVLSVLSLTKNTATAIDRFETITRALHKVYSTTV